MHQAISGVAGWNYFNPWGDPTAWAKYGGMVTMREHALLSDTMFELDSFLSCGRSSWILDRNMRWQDDFILTGADVKPANGNSSRIWRITPARPAEFRFPRQSPARASAQLRH